MEIRFTEGEASDIIDRIKGHLEGRKLGSMVEFTMDEDQLEVHIRKMGTSKLTFDYNESDNLRQWTLCDEKIALTHRAFKDEMISKLGKVIALAGGKLIL